MESVNYAAIVYGSAAVPYKADHLDGNSNATHRWTFYVRPAESGKDLGLIVSKVIFHLHPTCTLPVVECTQAPYETSQLGWGEVCVSFVI
jgi:YEATS domain-containing protein 4